MLLFNIITFFYRSMVNDIFYFMVSHNPSSGHKNTQYNKFNAFQQGYTIFFSVILFENKQQTEKVIFRGCSRPKKNTCNIVVYTIHLYNLLLAPAGRNKPVVVPREALGILLGVVGANKLVPVLELLETNRVFRKAVFPNSILHMTSTALSVSWSVSPSVGWSVG